MATLIDTGIIEGLAGLFPFLLTLVIVYALLQSVKIFGDNKAVQGLIALVLALMVLLSDIAVETINIIAPWFVLLFLIFIFGMIAYMIFGATEADVLDVLKTNSMLYTWIWVLVLVIGLGSLSYVMSQQGGFGPAKVNATQIEVTGDGTSQEVGFWQTLFHPKVLGAIFILLVSMFTLSKLASREV